MTNTSLTVILRYEGTAVKPECNCVVPKRVSCAAAVWSDVYTCVCMYGARNTDTIFAACSLCGSNNYHTSRKAIGHD